MRIFPFLAFVATSFAAEAQLQDEDFLIGRHQAGPVTIGADAYLLYEAFPRDRRQLIDLALEGRLSPALALTLPGSEFSGGVVAELIPSGNVLLVFRISVFDPMLRTAEGIGVGSTVGALRAKYKLDVVGTGEGRVFIDVDELSASFEIDQSQLGDKELWRVRDPQEIPDSTKIVRVLLIQ